MKIVNIALYATGFVFFGLFTFVILSGIFLGSLAPTLITFGGIMAVIGILLYRAYKGKSSSNSP